ncbi:MAG: hypothetical protein PUC41_05975 [Oscillospiraceae bacterium]|nr:hypothetical protein [Oscillospiraceae bacterium]
MKMQIPQQNTPLEKFLNISQFVIFLVSFFGLAVLIWRLFDAWWVRGLLLVVDYFVSSMILYCVFRPLAQKALKDQQDSQK